MIFVSMPVDSNLYAFFDEEKMEPLLQLPEKVEHIYLEEESNHDAQHSLIEEASFYLLAFLSWINGSRITTKQWELRNGKLGIFVVVSFIFLYLQTITLFDLSYEENLASYHCLGNSARLSVASCGCMVVVIVALKMLPEERRAFAMRLSIIHHAGSLSFYNTICRLVTNEGGKGRWYYFKVLALALFHKLREYGVIVMVYVAACEQIMLFDTVLQYVINSVVVLVVAELDPLIFESLARAEQKDDQTHHHIIGGDVVFHSVFDVTKLTLSKQEKNAMRIYDHLILRLNVLAMVLPLMNGKLTGANCSEHSRFRVSEICMLFLMMSRIALNIGIDLYLSRSEAPPRSPVFTGKSIMQALASLIEHAVPCFGYLAIMYGIFVVLLKPPTDDDFLS